MKTASIQTASKPNVLQPKTTETFLFHRHGYPQRGRGAESTDCKGMEEPPQEKSCDTRCVAGGTQRHAAPRARQAVKGNVAAAVGSRTRPCRNAGRRQARSLFQPGRLQPLGTRTAKPHSSCSAGPGSGTRQRRKQQPPSKSLQASDAAFKGLLGRADEHH